jgi:type II secretory pathway pseudopilin PulG
MTPPQNNSNLAPWKWALISASSTLVLALAGFGLYNLLNPKTSSISTSTSTSVATATPDNSVAKKLIGQWQGQVSGQSVTLIFTQEGKLFILDTPTSATETEYQINVNPQQKDLDILVEGQVITRIIFDFMADGHLRLELVNFRESRPTSFSSNATIFQKISEQTTLSANLQAAKKGVKNGQNKARQSEAKQYVSAMNRAQQAFYAENATFSPSIEKLGIGIKSETENYSYSIVLSNDKRFVQSIGLAKRDGLKNYTGIVYLTKNSDGEYTSTQSRLCESNQPSKELPGKPTATNFPDIQCPSDFSEVLR